MFVILSEAKNPRICFCCCLFFSHLPTIYACPSHRAPCDGWDVNRRPPTSLCRCRCSCIVCFAVILAAAKDSEAFRSHSNLLAIPLLFLDRAEPERHLKKSALLKGTASTGCGKKGNVSLFWRQRRASREVSRGCCPFGQELGS